MATTVSPDMHRPAEERRTRLRLRELCDEVLASYRVATDRDLFTDRERREARQLLQRLVPIGHD